MLRFRTGIIRFSGIMRLPTIELHVTPGFIRAVYTGERLLQDGAAVVDKLVAITAASTGKFTFSPARPDQITANMQLPIDGLILGVVTIVDEILYNKEHLPRREQVYAFAPVEAEFDLGEEDDQLLFFVKKARDQLELGTSAEDVAKVLEISVAQAQFYLLKLRSAGVVEPLRSADPFANDPALQLKSSGLRLASREEAAYESEERDQSELLPPLPTPSWSPAAHTADEPMPESGRIRRML